MLLSRTFGFDAHCLCGTAVGAKLTENMSGVNNGVQALVKIMLCMCIVWHITLIYACKVSVLNVT